MKPDLAFSSFKIFLFGNLLLTSVKGGLESIKVQMDVIIVVLN
jgi:hypothetical protein